MNLVALGAVLNILEFTQHRLEGYDEHRAEAISAWLCARIDVEHTWTACFLRTGT